MLKLLYKFLYCLPFLINVSLHSIPSSYEQTLIDHVQKSICEAESGISKLPNKVLEVSGYTSNKVRRLLNNLCSLAGTTYLEIGVWKGATFTAALWNNQHALKQAIAIDNWSEFGGPKKEFEQNCSDCISNVPYQFYSEDCFTIDKAKVFSLPITIYFYDGNHTEEDQEKAFTYFDSVFAPVFIAMVDDWNYDQSKNGTRKAFEKLGYTVLFEAELPARWNGDKEQWWHGLYIAVVRK